MRKQSHKIVVFDLDETLGCFVELGMFWDALENTIGKKLPQKLFFKVMDLFPEFVRPNIYKILSFLKKKKRHGDCKHVMIYTNNQGHRSWTEMIAAYFDKKMRTKFFDQIIAAFKVRGKVVEICRTSHDKSVEDLLRCTQMPPGTEICFLDDQYHPLMEDDSVYYINVKPFTQSLPFAEMAAKYFSHMKPALNRDEFIQKMVSFMGGYNYTVTPKSAAENHVDLIVGKQILVHLKEFFDKHGHQGGGSRKLRPQRKYHQLTRKKSNG